jgi:ubiquinone/menaquinone biosynthesis C-methylase UbiE
MTCKEKARRMLEIDSAARFSNRAQYYDAYRPRYPDTLLGFLTNQLGFSKRSVVADVGSGTGILTELLLRNGNPVFAVEPNRDMREIAEARLSRYSRFTSVDGSAESTTLRNMSVDFITAAQSFHWFRSKETKEEFCRILRKDGWVVTVWNTRKQSSPFLRAYEDLVNCVDCQKKSRVKHEDLTDTSISEFLDECKITKLANLHKLDLNGLIGRLLSASYFPLPGDPLYPESVRRATELFNRFQQNGSVTFEYTTEVYAGHVAAALNTPPI